MIRGRAAAAAAVSAVLAGALLLAGAWTLAGPVPAAAAEATWSGLEQPIPAGSTFPVGLGKIGDVEFWAPNRGLLITAGEEPTVPAGVWAYNGVQWHELSDVCGATDGRIAWAGPGEFWTVSDGRAGQANEIIGGGSEREVPLQDNTLCHFAHGEVLASYAHPADQPDSYQAMHAAACLSSTDCWFAGDPLEEPQVGAFHLHWNGSSLENEPYLGEGHAIEDMRAFEGALYESVRISSTDRVSEQQPLTPVLHRINPEGVSPLIEPEEVPFGALYESEEPAKSLDYLHLSAADGALWAAAGVSSEPVEPLHKAGQVTVARDVKGEWTQLIGPQHPLGAILPAEQRSEERELLGGEAKGAVVSAIAAEPGGGGAWLALSSPLGRAPQARAVLVHVSAEGVVGEERTLPSDEEEQEGIGPKGPAASLICPAPEDCWLATTQGWLFHLAPAGERSLPRDPDEGEYFTGLITYRPPDQGLPQVVPDAPPPDNSGQVEEPPDYGGTFAEQKAPPVEAKVSVPLLADLRSRLIGRTTLELRFHLAVKARVRLLAKRRRKVVASTPMHTFAAGYRKLLLRLNPREWPTKLSLQTHALAPLPTTTVKATVGGPEHGGAGSNTETTGLMVLPQVPSFTGFGTLP